MRSLLVAPLALVLSCAGAGAAALVPVPTLQPTLPVAGLEANYGQAQPGILFLSPGGNSLAVTAQSVMYSPQGATLTMVASNPNPTLGFIDPLPGLVNSYSGADPHKWVTGIRRFAEANLGGIYPGVNAQYAVDINGVLTLNLSLQAGVDPKVVVFQVDQATAITVNSDGSLLVVLASASPLGEAPYPSLSYAVPLATQAAASGQASRRVSFVVRSSTQFGLAVAGLDATLPLQISVALNSVPTAEPFSGYGNSQHASDAAGNFYVATQIADAAGKDAPFPTIGGVGCSDTLYLPAPCSDVAIYKYSAAGTLDFITYLAGRTRETAGFVGVAQDNSVVVAGTTDSADFPVTAAALQPAYAGPTAGPGTSDYPVSGDFFAARLDPLTGRLLNSTYLGGPNGDSMGAAALGADGSLYFLPAFDDIPSARMPVSNGALQADCSASPCQNGYAARLSPALDKLIYGTYLPGIAQATAQVYSDGSVYYAGTAGPGFPVTPSAYQPQNAGGYDAVVARLDPTGSHLLFATYFGGPDTDWALGLVVAPDGSVWAEVNSFVECCVNTQYELLHLDANGAHLLAKQPVAETQMAVDAAGNLYALATGGFTPSAEAFLGSSCGNSGYVELSPTGQQLFATYLPGDIIAFDGADTQGTPYMDTASGSRVQIVQGQYMGVYAGCVVDSASFGNEGTASPGAIVTIFGSALGPTQGTSFQLENGKVPTSLAGTQVLVNGDPVPVLYSSYWQVNLVLPYSSPVGTIVTVQVETPGAPGNQLSESIVEQGISFFSVGNGAAAALNQDGSLNSPQNPAKPGSTVMLFGTGGGQTNPPSLAGEITPLTLCPLVDTPQVQIPGVPPAPLTVEWAGAAPGLLSGATQVNVTLPDVIPAVPGYPAGTLPLQAVSDNFNSAVVTISVAAN